MNAAHEFLLVEEGYTINGYIPNNNGVVIGRSGLTIAAGVDVGQLGRAAFNAIPMSTTARESLLPFVGVSGDEAMRLLKRFGKADISVADAEAISNYMFDRVVTNVAGKYPTFNRLPPPAQTVMVSLAYNLGLNGSPSTSGKIARRDYAGAVTELRNPNEWANRELDGRRNREADLIQELS